MVGEKGFDGLFSLGSGECRGEGEGGFGSRLGLFGLLGGGWQGGGGSHFYERFWDGMEEGAELEARWKYFSRGGGGPK